MSKPKPAGAVVAPAQPSSPETFPLLGLVRDLKRRGWAVVQIDLTAEDLLERGKVLFDPEPREHALNNLKTAVVRRLMNPEGL